MTEKTIYDITTDEVREATQEDFDHMQRALQTSGKMVRVLRHLHPDLIPPSGPDFNERLDDALTRFLHGAGLST